MHPFEHLVDGAMVSPVSKALVNRRPRAVPLRSISPGSTGAKHPEHAVEHDAIIGLWASRAVRFIDEVRDQFPAVVGNFVSLFGHGRVLR